LLSILFIVYSLKLQYLFLSSTLAAVPIVVLLFLTGYSISSPIDACALVVALFCIPAGLSIQLLTEVYNLDFDSLIKRKTFTLIFGRQATNFLMYITVILSVIGAISIHHYSLFFAFIYTLFIGRFVLFPLFSSNLPKPLQNRTMIVVQRSPRLMRKLVRDSLTFFSLILAFLCFVFLLFIKLYVI
jgi:1,4-dihydroxy-2-naphthoate octaprenyltransferase